MDLLIDPNNDAAGRGHADWGGNDVATSATSSKLYFIDDVSYTLAAAPGGGGGGAGPTPATLISFETGDNSGYAFSNDWGGATSSVSSTPPSGGSVGSTKAGKVIKGAGDFWSGSTFIDTNGAGTTLIDSGHKVVTMNVYAPESGKIIDLKIEDHNNGDVKVERFATTTTVGWQLLTFDFTGSSDNGSPAFSGSATYDKASIFFSFAGGFTVGGIWYFDDVAFNGATTPALSGGGGGAGPTSPATLVSFESGDTSGYQLGIPDTVDFGGNVSSLSDTPPSGGSSGSVKAAKVIRGTETWSGSTFLNTKASSILLASASHKTVTMNVYAPVAGKHVLLKLEDADDPTHSVEAYATSTTVVGWQTLTFDLLTQRPDTAAFNEAYTFNKASIFFDYVTSGSFGNGDIYYFDDVAFNGATTPAVAGAEPVNPTFRFVSGSSTGFAGTPNDQGHQDWFQYYGSGVKYYTVTAEKGSALTMKWHVTNAQGAAATFTNVTFMVGKSYSVSNATFSSGYEGHAVINTSGAGGSDAAQISGTTDGNGDITFNITNTNANGETRPSDLNAADTLHANDGGVFVQVSLITVGGNQGVVDQDIVDIHFVEPAGAVTAAQIAITSNYFNGSNGEIDGTISNYDPLQTYSLSSDSAKFQHNGINFRIPGLSDGESVTVTATTTKEGGTPVTTSVKATYRTPLAITGGANLVYDQKTSTLTCQNATFNRTVTDAAYYLYVEGVMYAGQRAGTTNGLSFLHPEVNLSVGATVSSAVFAIDPNINLHNVSRANCVTQTFLNGMFYVQVSSAITLPRTGKLIGRTRTRGVAPVPAKPTAVTMRMVAPALTKDTAGAPFNYFDWTSNSVQNDWAKYYGPNLAFIYKYMTAGSTTTLTWHVTNTATGAALVNFPVKLIINKNYGGVQNATFSYSFSGDTRTIAASPINGGTGETTIASATNSNGDVSFTITNTNTAASAEAKPSALNVQQPATAGDLQTQITLTAGLAQTSESIDLVEFHITKP